MPPVCHGRLGRAFSFSCGARLLLGTTLSELLTFSRCGRYPATLVVASALVLTDACTNVLA
jgi:hypothetical protein